MDRARHRHQAPRGRQKRSRPNGVQLWTFQSNGPAHRFYERHGFLAEERTDGSGKPGTGPDVRNVWHLDAKITCGLLRGMGAEDAAGLQCCERVAVQVSVCGVDVAAAVSAVLSRWRETATGLALQGRDVVRAEAWTPEEFKRECEVEVEANRLTASKDTDAPA